MCGSQPGMQWWQKLSQQQGNIHISRNHIEGWGQDSLEYNGYALMSRPAKSGLAVGLCSNFLPLLQIYTIIIIDVV